MTFFDSSCCLKIALLMKWFVTRRQIFESIFKLSNLYILKWLNLTRVTTLNPLDFTWARHLKIIKQLVTRRRILESIYKSSKLPYIYFEMTLLDSSHGPWMNWFNSDLTWLMKIITDWRILESSNLWSLYFEMTWLESKLAVARDHLWLEASDFIPTLQ